MGFRTNAGWTTPETTSRGMDSACHLGASVTRALLLGRHQSAVSLRALTLRVMSGHPATQRGVTLIELLVALTVLAILLGIAIPSFTSIINGNRLSSNTNELIGAISYGRIQAIRRSQHVVLCRSDNANIANPLCTNLANPVFWTGWILFVDPNNNQIRDAGETVLRTSAIIAPVQIYANGLIHTPTTGRRDVLAVWSDGMVRLTTRQLVNAVIRVCQSTSLPSQNARDVSLDAGSRTSVAPMGPVNPCLAPNDPPP